jgi:hypothetical protein
LFLDFLINSSSGGFFDDKSKTCHILFCVVSILFIIVSGCTPPKPYLPIKDRPPRKNFQITLYIVGCTPVNHDAVHIRVIIDSQDTIVNKMFLTASDHPKFTFTLPEGMHQIIAQSDNGNAGLDVVYEVDSPLWLGLGYYGENHFQLAINKIPIIFL